MDDLLAVGIPRHAPLVMIFDSDLVYFIIISQFINADYVWPEGCMMAHFCEVSYPILLLSHLLF
jgi:hypothetical protein